MNIVFIPCVFLALLAGGCGSPANVTTHDMREPPPLITVCIETIELFGDETFKKPPPDHPAIQEVRRTIRTLAEGALRRQGFAVIPCNEPRGKLRVVIAVSVIVRFSAVVSVKSAAFSGDELLFELYSSARSQTYAEKDIIETQERLTDELARAFRKRIMSPSVPLDLVTPAH